ncbi:MAG: hypothetical protein IKJ35_00020 [Clostridia bacterium]|nr:hypothetical protein [Clostridia bacterium]
MIQPHFSTKFEDTERCFQEIVTLLNRCDESMDVIVCPESCDVPAFAETREQYEETARKYHGRMMEEAKKTAKRCRSMLFYNGTEITERGFLNTTFAINRNGEVVGKYYKQHLTPGEVEKKKLVSDYTLAFSEPTVVEMEGIRFAFLTCYDFYFYEMFSNLAKCRPDVIIGCSHQRTDTHDALEIITRFCAYQTNAYVFRSSVSMDENSEIGGGSMIVKPDGTVLENLKSRVGLATAEIDVTEKYLKPAGFGNPPSAHHEYVEKGRRPWKYRPAGSAIVPDNARMKYPRVCAHRGFCKIAPENSMPAYGAAVAMGADEIEFDLRPTKDGEIVSTHDSLLDRVSNGTGKVSDYTYEELSKLDFGSHFSEKFKGLKILKFEDILQKFACHCVMNIHVKSPNQTDPMDEDYLKRIIALIDKYDCRKYVYFMSANDRVLEQFKRLAPDIALCCGAGLKKWEIVDRAIAIGCEKVQLYKPYFNQEMIDKAHAHGIKCNVFWSDKEEEAREFLDMGIDTILTNDYHRIAQIVKERKKQ